MRKFIVLSIMLLTIFSFTGCESSPIKIYTKDNVVYFEHSDTMPDAIIDDDTGRKIENPLLFEKLVSAIDGKPQKNYLSDEEIRYTIRINTLHVFELYEHGIVIITPSGGFTKTENVLSVECLESEMNELFDILDSAINTPEALYYHTKSKQLLTL